MEQLRRIWKNNPDRWVVFGALSLFALTWAIYTQHVWEDYYITYRASKNLAMGNGLTFTAGERVHSFTSPLGVLLPALSSLLTANSSDDGALWLFRLMSISAYAGAGVLLWMTMRKIFQPIWPAIVLVVAYGIETKIVDNATNGMESGIVGLFLAWMIHACFTSPPRQILQIGLAWAGLMWSRPDSFIYIGAFGVGMLLLPIDGKGWSGRLKWLKIFLSAGLITTAVYLPWIIWTTLYYGTPVPHTVVAKGLGTERDQWEFLISVVIGLPQRIHDQVTMFQTVFMPPYSHNTGWPGAWQNFSYGLSMAGMFLWLIPSLRREARVLSFTYFGGMVYLMSFVGFPIPWYLPSPTTLCLAALCATGAQIMGLSGKLPLRVRPVIKPALLVVAVGSLLTIATITVSAAHHLKWQQKVVERGNREPLGRWLAENSSSSEATVFLEPLGYIGFYSNLKMLDYPGLSSPEVVAARAAVPNASGHTGWPMLIMDLQPTWLVLRSYEIATIQQIDPEILGYYYTLEREFDVREEVAAIPRLYGRSYLQNDAFYGVYRSDPAKFSALKNTRRITFLDLDIQEVFGQQSHISGQRFGLHAPSRIAFPVVAQARTLEGRFGLEDAAADNGSNGAEFIARLTDVEGVTHELFRRMLRPAGSPEDRGEQSFDLDLTQFTGGVIELEIAAGDHNNNAADWTYWSHLQFQLTAE
ncbi:MAG: hypothetical protein SynsKO_36290 [Synoicihabitans sp.]